MGLPRPQAEAGASALSPLPLDLSAVYLCFTSPTDKVPLVRYIYFLGKKENLLFAFC